jgi:hypothetical protein
VSATEPSGKHEASTSFGFDGLARRRGSIRSFHLFLLAGLLLSPCAGFSGEPAATAPKPQAAATPFAAALAEYRQKLEEYTAAQQKYEEAAGAYWSLIATKRRARIAKRRNNEAVLIDERALGERRVHSACLPHPPPRTASAGERASLVERVQYRPGIGCAAALASRRGSRRTRSSWWGRARLTAGIAPPARSRIQPVPLPSPAMMPTRASSKPFEQ